MLNVCILRLQPAQRLRQLSHVQTSARMMQSHSAVYASKAEKLSPAEPASVKQYQQHIMIQTAPLKTDKDAQQCHSTHGLWWPSVVEKHPAVIEAITAAAMSKANVKVTTYEEMSRDTFLEAGRPVCDLRLYPSGIQYTDLPIDKIRQVTSAHFDTSSTQTDDEEDEPSTSDQADPMAHLQQPMEGLHLYVCCHGSRDTRCGKFGNRLAHKLDRLIQQRQLQEQVQIFKCSHVGGHKYAGNVLVYGAISPCDGDWFGSVNDSNAEDFLNALLNMEVGSEGGPEHPDLRPLWRGRMGLSKQEQLDLFAGNIAEDEDSSDADDLQVSSTQALQASSSHDQAYSESSKLYSDLSTSRTDNSSQDGTCLCQSNSSPFAIKAQDTSDDDTEAETSSSDSDDSSDSATGSDASDSEGSDADPELPPPIKVQ